LIREVGIKSNGDDFGGMELIHNITEPLNQTDHHHHHHHHITTVIIIVLLSLSS